jgi:hypothetical protein
MDDIPRMLPKTEAMKEFFLDKEDLEYESFQIGRKSLKISGNSSPGYHNRLDFNFILDRGRKMFETEVLKEIAISKYGEAGLMAKRAKRDLREAKKRERETLANGMADMINASDPTAAVPTDIAKLAQNVRKSLKHQYKAMLGKAFRIEVRPL